MRCRSASLAASSCALLLAGCGGAGERAAPGPRPSRIPADLAQRLAAEANRVAAAEPGSCTARAAAARLQDEAIQAIRSGRVPVRYQEPLMSAANGLAARLASCTEPTRPDGHRGKKRGKKKHEQDE